LPPKSFPQADNPSAVSPKRFLMGMLREIIAAPALVVRTKGGVINPIARCRIPAPTVKEHLKKMAASWK